MQKLVLVALIGLALGGTVHAQGGLVFKYSNNNVITLQGCTKVAPQRVTCVGSVINNASDNDLYLGSSQFTLISPTGDEAKLSGATVKGNNAFSGNTQLRKGISYPIQLIFDGYSANSIKYFDAPYAQSDSRRLENVRLSAPGAQVTPPAPAPVTSGAASNLGPGQVVLNGRAYTVALTNCRINAAGAYVCTGATATPLR